MVMADSFGLLAAISNNISLMAASGGKAVVQKSNYQNLDHVVVKYDIEPQAAVQNMRNRPKADIRRRKQLILTECLLSTRSCRP